MDAVSPSASQSIADSEPGPSAAEGEDATAMSMMAPLPGGSASAYLGTLDVVYVYDEAVLPFFQPATAAGLEAAVLAGVATWQLALDTNRIRHRVRLLGIEAINWTYFVEPPNPQACSVNACRDRDTLAGTDGNADEVFALRAAYGADVVFGVVPPDPGNACGNLPDPGSTGCANNRGEVWNNPDDGGGPGNGFVTVTPSGVTNSTRHEFAHLMGIDHDTSGDCNASAVDYACGFSHVDACTCIGGPTCSACPQPTVPNLPGCVPIPRVSDIMSKLGIRQNLYSDPCAAYADPDGPDNVLGTCDDAIGLSIWMGDERPAADGKSSDAARHIRGEIDQVEDWVPENPVWAGSQMVSPSPGTTITTPTTTFTWTAPPAPTLHYVEVAVPNGAWSSSPVVSTTSTSVSVPTSVPVVKVRLWTFAYHGGFGEWVYQDYRYNIADQVLGCNVEEAAAVPAPAPFASTDCTSFQVAPFGSYWYLRRQFNGTKLLADLEGPGSGDASGTLVANFNRPFRFYDYALWGVGQNGDTFCCLYRDQSNAVTTIEMAGTSVHDTLAFTSGVYDLERTGAPLLTATMNALAGNDTLFGSNADFPFYAERLMGKNGNDTVIAGRGDDFINPGGGQDAAFGQCGDDTIVSPPDGTMEFSHGQQGDDVLCAGETADVLLGAEELAPIPGSVTLLYYSQGVAGHNQTDVRSEDSLCGYATNTPFGNCNIMGLSAPPGACAGVVTP